MIGLSEVTDTSQQEELVFKAKEMCLSCIYSIQHKIAAIEFM